jgi:glucose/arabinose dehydrogenase
MISRPRLASLLFAGLAGSGFLFVGAVVVAQDREPPRLEGVVGFLDKPGYLAFDQRLLSLLRVDRGFRVNVFARPGGNARIMAVREDGTVYLTRQNEGDVVLLRDADGDGEAENVRVVAAGLKLVHGVAIHEKTLYLIAPTTVWSAPIEADGSLGEPKVVIADLPDGGQHRARTIRVGRDGKLYMGVGSTCNACDETNPENATLLRSDPDGANRETFARGLRHTIGFDWNPATGALWGMDMGTDWRGNNVPPEELNQIVAGGNYGWPFCFGARRIDRLLNAPPPNGQSRAAYCAATQPAALTYTAHSAPIGLTFYDAAAFPAQYRGDAFVTLRGSWNRTPPSGYKVVRVRFDNGTPVEITDFLTGFQVDPKRHGWPAERGVTYQFARLAGIAVAADGALLVADDSNGVIYRVSYIGSTR